MLNIFNAWINRYFSNEEAVLLAVLIIFFLFVFVTMGAVLAPMFAGIIIAFLMQGMVVRLRSLGAPHVVAVSGAFLVLVTFMVIALFVVLPGFWRQLLAFVNEIPRMLNQGQELLLLLPQKYPSLVSEQQVQDWLEIARSEVGALGQSVVSISLANVPVFVGIMIYLILVPILVFFFLKDSDEIMAWLSSFLPTERPVMSKIWAEMNTQIANYVRGKVVEILIVGVTSYVCFFILGLRYSLLLGLAVGLSVLIPYIGAVVVTVPVALVGFFQWGLDGNQFMYLMITYGVIQGLDGNVLVPLLFSEAVNLHPVAIILAVLVFGGLWGFWGVFFAIPLATLFKAILNAWPLPGKETRLAASHHD